MRKAAREISVFTAAVLIVILVLARFELLGPLSRIITAPFDMIIRLLARLTAALAIMS